MFRRRSCLQSWAMIVALAGCLCWQPGWAGPPITNADALLEQTWNLQTTDHARSLQQLALLNREASRLTPSQQWRLRYLNAWEALYENNYRRSEVLFQDIVQHSGDEVLADRASAMLLGQYGLTRRYTEAFELANRLAARLPQITNPAVRQLWLINLAQSLGLAGQTDLAERYARMALSTAHTDSDRCYAVSFLIVALSSGHRLASDSPELKQALATCPPTREPVYHTDLQLTQIALLVTEGHPRRALALLDKIAPALVANGYAPNKLDAALSRARALAAVGDDAGARKAALTVVAGGTSSDFDEWLKGAYEVLYRLDKKQGNAAAALAYYEQFAKLDKAYLDDVHARTLAYEEVQQHVLMHTLETEKLSQQNAALRMQQALTAKTAEASRLYIVLLLLVLTFGALAMFRLRRSQLRFQRMARLDGLTAALNHQHFMSTAESELARLEKHAAMACLIYLDLDFFKRVNDAHGHAVGDAVLQGVAASCRSQLRAADLFGRLGGEEFGILLMDCPRERALDIAERVRRAIAGMAVKCGDRPIAVSASVGMAFTDTSGYNLRQLCADADAALYRAKDGGRNRLVAAKDRA